MDGVVRSLRPPRLHLHFRPQTRTNTRKYLSSSSRTAPTAASNSIAKASHLRWIRAGRRGVGAWGEHEPVGLEDAVHATSLCFHAPFIRWRAKPGERASTRQGRGGASGAGRCGKKRGGRARPPWCDLHHHALQLFDEMSQWR